MSTSISDLLATVLEQGAQLWADSDKLGVKAPRGALTAEVAERIRGGKDGLLELLGQRRKHALPSFGQERLWMLDQVEGKAAASYNVPIPWRLRGRLEPHLFRRAVRELVRRHESLRTVFRGLGGRPVQVVHLDPADENCAFVDLSRLDAERSDGEERRLVGREAVRPFDLARGPLVRTLVISSGDERHLLLVTVHHIVFDGWSEGVLERDLKEIYSAFCERREAELPELTQQCADVAAADRRRVPEDVLAEQVAYWREQLADPGAGELSSDRPRQEQRSHNSRSLSFKVDADLGQRLADVNRTYRTSPFMTLLAAFMVVLRRWTGHDDVTVGTQIAQRRNAEVENLVGFFLNTLVLRTRQGVGATFAEALETTRTTTLEAFANQDVPFARLVTELRPDRQAGRTPFFQVTFNLHNTPDAAGDDGTLAFERLDDLAPMVHFDLTVHLVPSDDGYEGIFTYDADLFDETTVRRLLDGYLALLDDATRHPEKKCAELRVHGRGARHQLVYEWSVLGRTPRPFEHGVIHELFMEQARRSPAAPAVFFGSRCLTYRDLDERSSRLAALLRATDERVGPEASVGLCVPRGLEMVVAVLAILKAGAVYVPLEPRLPAGRRRRILEQSGAVVVVGSSEYAEHFGDVAFFKLDDVDALPVPETRALPSVHSGNGAYIIFTSGSTGDPKGVLVTHGQLLSYVGGVVDRAGLPAGTSAAMLQPLAVDSSKTSLFIPLLTGGAVHVISEADATDPVALRQLAGERPYDLLKIAPTHIAALRDAGPIGEILPRRWLVVGGEAMRSDLAAALVEDGGERMTLFNHYGPTEATVGTHMMHVQRTRGRGEKGVTIPIGFPIGESRCFAVDRALRPVPAGAAGELLLGGPQVARGYVGLPRQTASVFIPDPWTSEPGQRLYRTGDQVRILSQGEVLFLGRNDDQVKIRGFRVEIGEVEAVLRRLDTIRHTIVIPRRDGGAVTLQALLVAEGNIPDVADVRRELGEQLPRHMIPDVYHFVDALPRTPHGKLDRRAAEEILRPLAVLREDRGLDEKAVGPRNRAESVLLEAWQHFLSQDDIGVNDNFFAIGGDSIIGIQVVARVNQQGLGLTPGDIFRHQTIAELAELSGETATDTPVVVAEADAPVPLTPIQQAFFERRSAEPWSELCYENWAVLLTPRTALDTAALRRALACVVAHHDALRMTYVEEDGCWRQQPAKVVRDVLVEVDLTGLGAAVRRQAVEQAANRLQRSLDPRSASLVRGAFFRGGGVEENRFLLIVHHLGVDAVSWPILCADLETALRGERLPPRTTPYSAWAERLSEASAFFRDQIGHWRGVLEAQVPLPVDFPDGDDRLATVTSVDVALDAPTSAALRDRDEVRDVLLAALALAFERWQQRRGLVVAVEGHGREDVGQEGLDVTRTVGWFTAIYPVLLAPPRDPREALQSVKGALRAVSRRGIGYGVSRYLDLRHLDDGLADLPEPEVAFNFLGRLGGASAPDGGLFQEADESPGETMSPRRRLGRRFLVHGGWTPQGTLEMSFNFSTRVYERKTVERLAGFFGDELDALLDGLKDVEDVYPVSPIQAGMLFHSLYEREDPAFMNVVVWHLESEEGVDGAALRSAWEDLVARHPVLRTSFVWEGVERPLQVVHRRAELSWQEHDARGVDVEAFVRGIFESERQRGFDLGQAPLLRFHLVRSGKRSILVRSLHHLIADGWSTQTLYREMLELYAAHRDLCRTGRRATLPPAKPFSTYMTWLEDGERLDEAARFWSVRMAGLDEPTLLAEEPLHPAQGLEVAQQRWSLDRAAKERLDAFARRHHLTLNTVMQGAWAILLARVVDRDEVVFGVTVSGRPPSLAGSADVVGPFINTLPLRTKVPRGAALVEWLRELQEHNVELRQHEQTPLAEIQAFTDVPRPRPIFDTILVFENYPVHDAGEKPPLEIVDASYRSFTNNPLTLTVLPSSDGVEFYANHHPDRIASTFVARMLRRLTHLLAALPEGAECPLGRLPWLVRAERHHLREWAELEFPASEEATLTELFEAQVRRTPDAPALTCGEATLTYAELDRRASAGAALLRPRVAAPESLVGIHLSPSVEMVVAVLAVLKTGGAYVPLDPKHPEARHRRLVERHGLAAVVTSADRAAAFAPCPGFVLDAAPETPDPGATQPSPANAAYVIFTSGSTGEPKGVVVEHRQVVSYVRGVVERLAIRPGACHAMVQSLSVDSSKTVLFGALLTGGHLVVLTEDERLSAPAMGRVFRRHGVDVLKIAPSHLAALTEAALSEEEAGERPLPRTHLVVGGEALRWRNARAWLEQEATQVPPGCRVFNHYGPTEATVGSHAFPLFPGIAAASPTVPIGRPLASSAAWVVSRDLEPAATGSVGELLLGGASVARGYLRQPRLTAWSFIPDPFSESRGQRLYRTGDLVRLLGDGSTCFLRRKDEQVKIHGFRIEPREIEAAMTAHPSVREAAVVLVDENGRQVLHGFAAADVEEAELRSYLEKHLPLHMVPGRLTFLDELPRSLHGKVDRKELTTFAGATERRGTTAPNGLTTPRPPTPDEKVFQEIFQNVLRLDERPGLEDNFFALGGDSILSILLVSQAAARGFHVTPRDLFQWPTTAALASRARRSPRPTTAAAEAVRTPLPLTPIQRRFFRQHREEPWHYNWSFLLKAQGAVDTSALHRAVAALVERHDVLRLSFTEESGEWHQQLLGTARVPFAHVDLSRLDEEHRRRAVSTAGERLQKSLDLARGPLSRFVFFQDDMGRQYGGGRVLVILHHLAVDAVAWSVLADELETAYLQMELPPRTTPFTRWASVLAGEAKKPRVLGERDAWADVLRSIVPLPADFPEGRPEILSHATWTVSLDPARTRAVLRLPAATQTQINDVLLTALARTLGEYASRREQVVWLEGHGRDQLTEEVDLTRTVGWLTCAYPMRLEIGTGEIDTGASPADDLAAISAQIRAVPRDGLAFGLLAPSLDELPLPDVMFNYMGGLDPRSTARDGFFAQVDEPHGEKASSRGERPLRLTLNAGVVGGRLEFRWTYSRNVYREGTVRRLAERTLEELQALVTAARRQQ